MFYSSQQYVWSADLMLIAHNKLQQSDLYSWVMANTQHYPTVIITENLKNVQSRPVD